MLSNKQFIKRVEEITGMNKIFYGRNGRDNTINMLFQNGKKHLHICDDNVKYFEKCFYKKRVGLFKTKLEMSREALFIPNKWLIPLGEAIKEYYND